MGLLFCRDCRRFFWGKMESHRSLGCKPARNEKPQLGLPTTAVFRSIEQARTGPYPSCVAEEATGSSEVWGISVFLISK
jgi:hypothetical protein